MSVLISDEEYRKYVDWFFHQNLGGFPMSIGELRQAKSYSQIVKQAICKKDKP